MREYEFIYVIQPDATPEREKEIHARVDDVLARGGGTYLIRDDWGKRKLAYEIRKFQKGHYFQLGFLSDGALIPELERLMRLDVDVLRFLTVLANERVRDVEARIAEAREQEAEQQRRREERERQEEERAQQEAAANAKAAAERSQTEAAAAAEAALEPETGGEKEPGPSEPEAEPSATEKPAERAES
ncbi:MAG: 30S ribosomal protein S6 [Myxococcota bacterium]